MGGGNFVQVSSFDEWVGPRSAQPPGRPRPPQRPGCMGMSAFGWWLLWILSFSLASQGSESVVCHIFSLLSLITLKFPRVGPTG